MLAWERNARQHGSKINVEQLLATWWLDDVFNRDGRSGVIGTSAMLKAIGACLILKQSTQAAEQNQLLVANQVSIGASAFALKAMANRSGNDHFCASASTHLC